MTEPRKSERVVVSCQVFDNDENNIGLAINLAESGIRIKSPLRIQKSNPMDITIIAPERRDLTVKSKVQFVWRHKCSPKFASEKMGMARL